MEITKVVKPLIRRGANTFGNTVYLDIVETIFNLWLICMQNITWTLLLNVPWMFKVRLTNIQCFENIMKDQLTLNNGLLMLLGECVLNEVIHNLCF